MRLIALDRTMELPLTLAGGLRAVFADVVSCPLPERLATLVRRLHADRNERSGEERDDGARATKTSSRIDRFAQLRDIPEGKESGADGMALDREGRVYITTVTGVQVFDAAGKYLGTIKMPRQPANAGFSGPDKRVLFITAREGLYRLNMLAQGPDRIGK